MGFRYFAKREAAQLGLSGYVKNRYDGRVEIFVQGDKEIVDHFLKILEHGPRFGRVDAIASEESEFRDEYTTFNIEY